MKPYSLSDTHVTVIACFIAACSALTVCVVNGQIHRQPKSERVQFYESCGWGQPDVVKMECAKIAGTLD